MNDAMEERFKKAEEYSGLKRDELMNELFLQHNAEQMMIEEFTLAKAHVTLQYFAEYLVEYNPPHNALLESIVAFTMQSLAQAHEAAHELMCDRLGGGPAFDDVRKALYLSKDVPVERQAGAVALKKCGVDERKFIDYVENAGYNEFLRDKEESNG